MPPASKTLVELQAALYGRNDQDGAWYESALFVYGVEVPCEIINRLKGAAQPTGFDILFCRCQSPINLRVFLDQLLRRQHELGALPLDFDIVAKRKPKFIVEFLGNHHLAAGADFHCRHSHTSLMYELYIHI